MADQEDSKLSRYEFLNVLSKTAQSSVWKSRDQVTGKKFAVKEIEYMDDKCFSKRCLYEIKLLRHFSHENIIPLQDVLFKPDETLDNFFSVSLVMPLMQGDLSDLLQSSVKLDVDHCKLFIYQILRALKYIHSAGVFHRDLKPQNVLVNFSDGFIKICDFGTGRQESQVSLRMTRIKQVATFNYRAPEAILSKDLYNELVDLWSAGCIFVEMLLHSTVPFFPGINHINLIESILDIVGPPTQKFLAKFPPSKAKEFVQSKMSQALKPSLPQRLSALPRDATDLATKLLEFEPEKRINAKTALSHEFLRELSDPSDEPACAPFSFPALETMNLRELRKCLWDVGHEKTSAGKEKRRAPLPEFSYTA